MVPILMPLEPVLRPRIIKKKSSIRRTELAIIIRFITGVEAEFESFMIISQKVLGESGVQAFQGLEPNDM